MPGAFIRAPRAYWKGYLKLSLVSCPIALFPATSEREKISFHQLNKKTGHRVKYRKVDAESGDEVDSAEDQYEDALKELLKKKQEGKPIERPERPKPTNVVNLMDALRQSVEASGAATSTKAKARAASPRSSFEKAEHPKPKRTRRTG